MMPLEAKDNYQFGHLLMREAAYSSLLASNRAKLHHLAARELTELILPGTPLEMELLPQLCTHLCSAGMWAQAHQRQTELLLLLAQTGHTQGWDELFQAAQRSWWKAQPDAEIGAQNSPQLLVCLATRFYLTGAFQAAMETAREAEHAAAVAGDERPRAAALTLQGMAHLRLAETGSSDLAFAAALALHEQLGDTGRQCEIYHSLAVRAREAGLGQDSIELSLKALALARQSGNKRLEAVCLIGLNNTASNHGSILDSHSYIEEAVRISRELGDLESEAACCWGLARAAATCGQAAECEAIANRSLAICELTGNQRSRIMALCALGLAQAQQGRLAEARASLAQGVALAEATQHVLGQLGIRVHWGIAERLFGSPEEAGAQFAAGLKIAPQLGGSFISTGIRLYAGEDAMLRGDFAGAEALIPAAAAICEGLGTNWIVPARCILARLRWRQGHAEEAKAWLGKAKEAAQGFVGRYEKAIPLLEIRRAEQDIHSAADREQRV